MATKKKASPAQIAARKLFAERARAGTLRKGVKKGKRKAAVKENPISKSTAYARALRDAKMHAKLYAKYPDGLQKVYKLKAGAATVERRKHWERVARYIENGIKENPAERGAPSMHFSQVPVKSFFECNGNDYKKVSTRTAKMLSNDRTFFFNKNDNCKIIDGVKKNPAKKRAAKRVKKSISAPSQITKRAPSKRLKSRRAANTKQGYFPNPKRKLKAIPTEETRFGVYESRKSFSGEPLWIFQSSFVKKFDAFEYARALHRKNKSSYVKVEPVKVVIYTV